jgi:hypothetical protein
LDNVSAAIAGRFCCSRGNALFSLYGLSCGYYISPFTNEKISRHKIPMLIICSGRDKLNIVINL